MPDHGVLHVSNFAAPMQVLQLTSVDVGLPLSQVFSASTLPPAPPPPTTYIRVPTNTTSSIPTGYRLVSCSEVSVLTATSATIASLLLTSDTCRLSGGGAISSVLVNGLPTINIECNPSASTTYNCQIATLLSAPPSPPLPPAVYQRLPLPGSLPSPLRPLTCTEASAASAAISLLMQPGDTCQLAGGVIRWTTFNGLPMLSIDCNSDTAAPVTAFNCQIGTLLAAPPVSPNIGATIPPPSPSSLPRRPPFPPAPPTARESLLYCGPPKFCPHCSVTAHWSLVVNVVDDAFNGCSCHGV